MAVNKELKFNFSLDDQSFLKVKAALESLTNQAKELAKAMNAAGGGAGSLLTGAVGGTTGSKPSGMSAAATGASSGSSSKSIVQNVQMTAEAYKRLSAISVSAMRAVDDSTRRTFTEQKTRVKELENQIISLGRAYESMADKGSDAAKGLTDGIKAFSNEIAEIEKKMGGAGIGGSKGVAAGGAGGRFGTAAGMFGMIPGMGGAGQAISAGQTLGAGLGLGAAGMMGLGGVAALGYAGYTGLKAYQSNITGPMNRMAERGSMTNQLISGAYAGDRSQQVLLRAMAAESSANKSDFVRRYGGGSYDALQLIQAGGRQLKDAATGGDLLNFENYVRETGKFKDLQEGMTTFGNTSAGGAALRANQYFQSTMSERIGYNRFFGGGQKKLGIDASGRVTGSAADDAFAQRKIALEAQGYSLGELQGASMQAMGIGGMAMRRQFAGTIMSANAGGFGQLGDVLGMTARASGQTLLGKGGGAGTRGMAAGFFGGGIDPIAAMHLAQMTTRGGFDVTGTTSGQGLLAAIQSSTGFGRGIQDVQSMNRIQAGIGAGNMMMRGGSGFDQGFRVLAAMQAAGGGSTYLQDYLASGMNMAQMMDAARGQGTATFKGLGGTAEMAKSMLGSTGESYLAQYVEQGSGDVDSEVARFKQSGLSLQEYMRKNKGSSKNLAIAANLASGGTLTEEGAISSFAMLSGDPTGAIKKGKLPGAGGLDAIAQKQAEETAAIAKTQLEEAYKNIGSVFGKDGDVAKMMIKAFESFGSNLSNSADQASASLYELAGAADMAAAVRKRIAEGQSAKDRQIANTPAPKSRYGNE